MRISFTNSCLFCRHLVQWCFLSWIVRTSHYQTIAWNKRNFFMTSLMIKEYHSIYVSTLSLTSESAAQGSCSHQFLKVFLFAVENWSWQVLGVVKKKKVQPLNISFSTENCFLNVNSFLFGLHSCFKTEVWKKYFICNFPLKIRCLVKRAQGIFVRHFVIIRAAFVFKIEAINLKKINIWLISFENWRTLWQGKDEGALLQQPLKNWNWRLR